LLNESLYIILACKSFYVEAYNINFKGEQCAPLEAESS
jgi:hypothetical protein